MSNVLSQAIEVLLADREIKQAVLGYFKSITQEEWQDIYRRQSEEVRYFVEEIDPVTGLRDVHREVRMYAQADYNKNGDVGRISVLIRPDGYFDPFHYHRLDHYSYGRESRFIIAEVSVLAVHPAGVIDYIFAHWDEWLVEFRERTTATKEPVKVEAHV